MGTLTRERDRLRVLLPERGLVGRSPACDLRLSSAAVSSEHAALRWSGRRWVVVDFGSRNGTRVDGEALDAGVERALDVGARLRFAVDDELWILSDDGPPQLFARREQGEQHGVDELLVLPTPEEPLVTIYRDLGAGWTADDGLTLTPLEDRQLLLVEGAAWRVYLPGATAPTRDLSGPLRSLPHASLALHCSRDEENIRAELRWADDVVDLDYRAHHGVLLQLLRARLADAEQGLGASDRGWLHREELARQLAIDSRHLNIMIYRLRRQLGDAGVVNPAAIIERRGRSGELRLGALRRATLELRGELAST